MFRKSGVIDLREIIHGRDHDVTVAEHRKKCRFKYISYRVAHIECHHTGERADHDAKDQHDRPERLGEHILQCVFKYNSHFLTFLFIPGGVLLIHSPDPLQFLFL